MNTTDPQSPEFNLQSLYFLTKKQLIDICIEKRLVLNQTEDMLKSIAQQLADINDQKAAFESEKENNDRETVKIRSELKNFVDYSQNFDDLQMNSEID